MSSRLIETIYYVLLTLIVAPLVAFGILGYAQPASELDGAPQYIWGTLIYISSPLCIPFAVVNIWEFFQQREQKKKYGLLSGILVVWLIFWLYYILVLK